MIGQYGGKNGIPLTVKYIAHNSHTQQHKEKEKWGLSLPEHLCVDPKYQFYLPLDRALRVTQSVICFLDEKEYNSALKALEHAVVFLNPDGSLHLPEGMHTLVRSAVREFLSVECDDGHDLIFMEVSVL